MSDKYTPTTEWLAKRYPPGTTPEMLEEVHDWFEISSKYGLLEAIVCHDRKVVARALREAANEWSSDDYGPFVQSYLNNRADAIESGERFST